jgi:hypothetical protein
MRRGLIGQAMRKRRVAIAFALFIAGNVSGQDLVPSSPAPQPAGATPEVERVIVTGSNIPTAEETGPNPVDTYRTEDIQKLGAYNATDLLTKLPQEMGSTINQNIANGGDGSVIPNLRGLLPKLRPSAAIAQPQLSLDGGSSICECAFGRAFTVGI